MGSKKKTTQNSSWSRTSQDHPMVADNRQHMWGRARNNYDIGAGLVDNIGPNPGGYVGIGQMDTPTNANTNVVGNSRNAFGVQSDNNNGNPIVPGNGGWGDQQIYGQDQAISSARAGQDYFRRVLAGEFLNPGIKYNKDDYRFGASDLAQGEFAGNHPLVGGLNAINQANLEMFEDDILPGLTQQLNTSGAYKNLESPDLVTPVLDRFHENNQQELNSLLYDNYTRERQNQQFAPQNLAQQHTIENIFHDARLADAQAALQAKIYNPLAFDASYNALLNANPYRSESGSSKSESQVKESSSPLPIIAGLAGAAMGAPGAGNFLKELLSGGGSSGGALPTNRQPGGGRIPGGFQSQNFGGSTPARFDRRYWGKNTKTMNPFENM